MNIQLAPYAPPRFGNAPSQPAGGKAYWQAQEELGQHVRFLETPQVGGRNGRQLLKDFQGLIDSVIKNKTGFKGITLQEFVHRMSEPEGAMRLFQEFEDRKLIENAWDGLYGNPHEFQLSNLGKVALGENPFK